MTSYELLDIGIAAGNRLDVQWGLFVTVHLAILGGIAYVDRPLRPLEKVGAMAVYVSFIIVNYRATRFHMGLLQHAYREVADMAVDSCCINSKTVAFVARDVASGRFDFANTFATVAHLLMAALVVLAIIFNVELSSRLKEQE